MSVLVYDQEAQNTLIKKKKIRKSFVPTWNSFMEILGGLKFQAHKIKISQNLSQGFESFAVRDLKPKKN